MQSSEWISLRLPCEIVVNDLLPFLRKAIAEYLHTKGFTQTQIAQMLNVSQPAVSYYLKQEVSSSIYSTGFVKERSFELAEALIAKKSTSQIIRSTCQLCLSLRPYGSTCQLHREQIDLEEDCTACIVTTPLPSYSEKDEALQDLKTAIALLENTPEAINLMPEVAIQIVRSIPSAKNIDEMAAIPGRVVKVKERLKSVASPEFGVSQHTARLLLALMRKDQFLRIKAMICIRYDHKIQDALDTLGITYSQLQINSSAKKVNQEDYEVTHAIETQLNAGKTPETIIDPGGEGREAIAYLLGKTAVEVVQQALRIAKKIQER
jgi:predicted fused transcriptional regulator/phosphomethylpyrimidine kinase/predicted transcriptional regulator